MDLKIFKVFRDDFADQMLDVGSPKNQKKGHK